MAITQATSSVLAANAALNNLNAGANITFTKQVVIPSLGGAAFGSGVTTALSATANATGGIITTNGTATLTNKTLTSPVITDIANSSTSGALTITTNAITDVGVLRLRNNNTGTNTTLHFLDATSNARQMTIGYGNASSASYASSCYILTQDRDLYLSTANATVNATNHVVVKATTGLVGIGTASPSERLTVSGNISASGTVIASNYNPAANVATFLATPTSANLAAAVSDETGTGSLVFGTSPTISSPTFTNFFTSSLTDSIATCVRDGPIPKFRLFEDFGNAGVGITAGAGNNGFSFTSTAGRGSNAVYTQPFGNRGVSVLAHGINSITTGATLADTASYFLPLGGGGTIGCSGQYCFALASTTNVIVDMGIGVNANIVSFQINSALGQLNVIQGGTVGSSTTTLLSSITLSTGNFSSGTRYRFYYKIVSTTEVDVYLASAPFNSTTWTTIYSGIATIPAMTLTATENLVFPYFGLRTNETATKTMYIDWIAVEKDVTR
jgi:hypothetical protein